MRGRWGTSCCAVRILYLKVGTLNHPRLDPYDPTVDPCEDPLGDIRYQSRLGQHALALNRMSSVEGGIRSTMSCSASQAFLKFNVQGAARPQCLSHWKAVQPQKPSKSSEPQVMDVNSIRTVATYIILRDKIQTDVAFYLQSFGGMIASRQGLGLEST